MTSSAPGPLHHPRATALGFSLDLAVLVAFIAAGRRTHEGTGWAGFVEALRPFLIALLLAWVGVLLWQSITASRARTKTEAAAARARMADAILGLWPAGYGIWIFTALGGLTFRALTGGGVAGAFPLVATGMLGAGFIGWRLIGALLRRRRA